MMDVLGEERVVKTLCRHFSYNIQRHLFAYDPKTFEELIKFSDCIEPTLNDVLKKAQALSVALHQQNNSQNLSNSDNYRSANAGNRAYNRQ